MFTPGDVIFFWSDGAGKPKYHLCVALNNCFFYVNSPKTRTYPGDFIIPCADMPFLKPTPSGESIISCTSVLRFSDRTLKKLGAEKKGELGRGVIVKLIAFVEAATVLSQADKDEILDALADRLR